MKILSGFLNWNLNHQTCERNCLVKWMMEIENGENLREFSTEIIHISTVIMYRVRNKKLLWILFSCLSRSKHFSEFNGEKVELGIWKYNFFYSIGYLSFHQDGVFLHSSNLLEDSSFALNISWIETWYRRPSQSNRRLCYNIINETLIKKRNIFEVRINALLVRTLD